MTDMAREGERHIQTQTKLSTDAKYTFLSYSTTNKICKREANIVFCIKLVQYLHIPMQYFVRLWSKDGT